MANRNWDELNRSAKIMTVTKIALIGATGVAVLIISNKAIKKFTAEAIRRFKPLTEKAPETTLEAEVQ